MARKRWKIGGLAVTAAALMIAMPGVATAADYSGGAGSMTKTFGPTQSPYLDLPVVAFAVDNPGATNIPPDWLEHQGFVYGVLYDAIEVTFPGADPQFAYCIDPDLPFGDPVAGDPQALAEIDRATLGLTAQQRQRIEFILTHSVPARTPAEVLTAAGLEPTALDEAFGNLPAAVAAVTQLAVQAALGAFPDQQVASLATGYTPEQMIGYGLVVYNWSEEGGWRMSQRAVGKTGAMEVADLFNYFVTNWDTPPAAEPTLTITSPLANWAPVGSRVGPYVVRTNAAPVQLSTDFGALVDAAGNPISVAADGTEFYLAGAQPGTATISATASVIRDRVVYLQDEVLTGTQRVAMSVTEPFTLAASATGLLTSVVIPPVDTVQPTTATTVSPPATSTTVSSPNSSPISATVSMPQMLPATGSDTSNTALLAILTTCIGMVLVAGARRRRPARRG